MPPMKSVSIYRILEPTYRSRGVQIISEDNVSCLTPRPNPHLPGRPQATPSCHSPTPQLENPGPYLGMRGLNLPLAKTQGVQSGS